MENNGNMRNYNSFLFGERLQSLMDKKGITQQQLAEKTNIVRQTISLYTKGKGAPSAEIIFTLATILNVSADYLLGITNTNSENPTVIDINNLTGLSDVAIGRLCANPHPLNGCEQMFETTSKLCVLSEMKSDLLLSYITNLLLIDDGDDNCDSVLNSITDFLMHINDPTDKHTYNIDIKLLRIQRALLSLKKRLDSEIANN